MAIERIIPIEEVAASEHYDDMAELAVIFNHEIVEDDSGVWRWKENKLSNYILHGATFYEGYNYQGSRTRTYVGSLDINTMWIDLYAKKFSVEEMFKFYMQIGYSLCGFGEVFGQREAFELDLPGAKEPDEDNENYTQTILDYMRERYKGRALKL